MKTIQGSLIGSSSWPFQILALAVFFVKYLPHSQLFDFEGVVDCIDFVVGLSVVDLLLSSQCFGPEITPG